MKSGTGEANQKEIYLFYILMSLILARALYLRLSLPHIAIIDNDISGYLDPSLSYLGGRGFEIESVRGFCYPFFVLLNILLGRSIDAVALCQHMLAMIGLIMIALALIESLLCRVNYIKSVILLLGMMLIGWDKETILLEHTIRPEGLGIFFAGTIFFLLQRQLSRPGFKVYITLMTVTTLLFLVLPKFVLGGIVVILYASYSYISFRPRSIRWIKQIFILMLGYYIMGGIFIVLVGVYQYLQDRAKRVSDKYFNALLLSISLILVLAGQALVEKYFPDENSAAYFSAVNFFYINCRIIEQADDFEKWFTRDEKAAVRYAVAESKKQDKNTWPILGFDADDLTYGHVSDYIVGRYGHSIYGSVMRKALVFCFPQLMHKAIIQMRYYYEFNGSQRIPATYTLLDYDRDLRAGMSNSFDGLSTAAPEYIAKYKSEVSAYLSHDHQYIPGPSPFQTGIWQIEMRLSSILIDFAAIYIMLMLVRGKVDALVILFMVHFLTLLTIVVFHTLDIGRYSNSLFPFFAVIVILSAFRFCDGVGMVYKRASILFRMEA
jgi:hypothetical protein